MIAHDRREHGRSAQVDNGHGMDHYAADVAAVVAHLDLVCAIILAIRRVRRGDSPMLRAMGKAGCQAGPHRAVPPIMVKTPANPGGLPVEVLDGFRKQLASNRAQFYRDIASGPFFSFNRPGAKVLQSVVDNWWRQA